MVNDQLYEPFHNRPEAQQARQHEVTEESRRQQTWSAPSYWQASQKGMTYPCESDLFKLNFTETYIESDKALQALSQDRSESPHSDASEESDRLSEDDVEFVDEYAGRLGFLVGPQIKSSER